MGGCRCTFRSCTVNTLNFPGMHFFHYPLKHQERLEEWIKNANYHRIREMSPAQARNKVVCALHFRDECFMNYKKDRLIPVAVPTLSRLKNGLVLDYSLSGKPQAISLSPTKEQHLIPPKGYIPLGLPENFFINSKIELLEEDDVEARATEPLTKRPRIKITMAPKILNKGVRFPLHSHLEENEVTTIDRKPFDEEDYGLILDESGKCEQTSESMSITEVVNANGEINLSEIEFLSTEKEVCVDDVVSREAYDQTVEEFECELTEVKQDYSKKLSDAEDRLARMKIELEETKEEAKLATASAHTAELSARKWQEKFNASEMANQELAMTSVQPKQKSVGAVQLTKPQLFNGIKKYLSASMTALVRMEMFGGPERQWKPDEKQASVELLRLGERVYEYFSDEWRFRLPPKKLAQEWSNEVREEDEDDL